MLLADSLVAAARCAPHSSTGRTILDILCGERDARAPVRVSPIFLVGVLLSAAGTSLRMLSFNELGRLFTFDIALRDKHQLVTSGPYAIVRHPAAVGYTLLWAGLSACLFARGSWWAEVGIGKSAGGKVVRTVWALLVVQSVLVGCGTMAWKEERMLRRAFGKEYADYVRRTPKMFVPGIW
ncbi:hypothetical protein K488DRAFT_54225 [Vararia minispora EC-137]|uniref:Uncharacterized protein n=1 Tax=Vararia minispora EC-137 TaxID=1314806 RepID=A0ACB8QGM8_9AGAM|nr:hypothetical protein K488DRAFT_54225 [Vararia minispora EC-137]